MTSPLPNRAIDVHEIQLLDAGWQLTATAPGACETFEQLRAQNPMWRNAIVPGTVAQSVGADFNTIGNYDAEDWWYRCTFSATTSPDVQKKLRFDGLATLAEVWLNGTPILHARNMFVAHSCDVTQLLRDDNELVICFRALNSELAARKPRPRWKTALVNQQNLRWVRTTPLGRIPGWTPPITPVGPWRPIALETTRHIDIHTLDLQTSARGHIGHIHVTADLTAAIAQSISSATLHIGKRTFELTIDHSANLTKISGEYLLPDIALWWPHTHGVPHLHECHIELHIGAEKVVLDCGRVGFKEIALDRTDGKVQLLINGTPIFCRGACWTINDFLSLTGTAEQLREALQLAQNAQLNMLRIGGTMTYESDAFYALCDELGILVWQDFMFANMDYPFADVDFRGEVEREVAYQLNRLQKHPCIAVYCGNSEVEQQAAMVGLPPTEWSNAFFSEDLPQRCVQLHRDIPYFSSTPCEGALPFHVATGLAHYYGVSAYRKPLTDAKHANVKFASECLGFSNVPDTETIELILDGVLPPPHHPRWKARVGSAPASFDFEAIRDDYLKILFKTDPAELRHCDLERYYALSRVVSGEVMKTVFAEWRKPGSACGGGLIWFYKDLWPGAGWGIVDSTNRPKAAYWYLRRAWAARALLITDEGLDGLALHVINETSSSLSTRIELTLYQNGRIKIGEAQAALTVPANSAQTMLADAMLPHFFDITYSYRFGAPKHDVVCARIVDTNDNTISEDFYFPLGLSLPAQDNAHIDAHAQFDAAGNVTVTLECNTFLQSVALSANGFTASDNYFHLAPHQKKHIYFSSNTEKNSKFKAHISALNLSETITLRADRV